jgi:hypothetical protein
VLGLPGRLLPLDGHLAVPELTPRLVLAGPVEHIELAPVAVEHLANLRTVFFYLVDYAFSDLLALVCADI